MRHQRRVTSSAVMSPAPPRGRIWRQLARAVHRYRRAETSLSPCSVSSRPVRRGGPACSPFRSIAAVLIRLRPLSINQRGVAAPTQCVHLHRPARHSRRGDAPNMPAADKKTTYTAADTHTPPRRAPRAPAAGEYRRFLATSRELAGGGRFTKRADK